MNTIVPLNKRNLNNTMHSLRSGLAFYSIIGKKNQTFIQKVSLEYNDNIMKLNNLEKRKLSLLRGIPQQSKTHHANEVLVT